MLFRGGMRERLKRVVLKTTVRGTVPGVRIPLPPPEARFLNHPAFSPAIASENARLQPENRPYLLGLGTDRVELQESLRSYLPLQS